MEANKAIESVEPVSQVSNDNQDRICAGNVDEGAQVSEDITIQQNHIADQLVSEQAPPRILKVDPYNLIIGPPMKQGQAWECPACGEMIHNHSEFHEHFARFRNHNNHILHYIARAAQRVVMFAGGDAVIQEQATEIRSHAERVILDEKKPWNLEISLEYIRRLGEVVEQAMVASQKQLEQINEPGKQENDKQSTMDSIQEEEDEEFDEESSENDKQQQQQQQQQAPVSNIRVNFVPTGTQQPLMILKNPVHQKQQQKQPLNQRQQVKTKAKTKQPKDTNSQFFCKACGVGMTGPITFEAHMKGKKHLKCVETLIDRGVEVPVSIPTPQINSQKQQKFLLTNPNVTKKEDSKEYYCDICNINTVGRIPFEDHLKGKKHNAHKAKQNDYLENTEYVCELCNVTMCGQIPYEEHLNGKKHLKILKRLTGSSVIQVSDDSENEDNVVSKVKSEKPPQAETLKVSKPIQTVDQPNKPKVPKFDQHSPDSPFYCNICKIGMTGQAPYDMHIKGKKHQMNATRVANGQEPYFLKKINNRFNNNNTNNNKRPGFINVRNNMIPQPINIHFQQQQKQQQQQHQGNNLLNLGELQANEEPMCDLKELQKHHLQKQQQQKQEEIQLEKPIEIVQNDEDKTNVLEIKNEEVKEEKLDVPFVKEVLDEIVEDVSVVAEKNESIETEIASDV
eukprot:TRINITY_DN13997_c0_g1_i1.p1 TRINITY_DN13997_c0_g1~~TRINITY_DN13997_c0_g1_i1.p1  ORF type:complete len:679 (-),score=262.67 TRINITY_DN13997_c0_g1_i1:446-2482(-)